MHNYSPSWFVLRSKATADIHYEALVPAVVFTTLAFLMVALRWCSRICSRSGKIEAEDYFVTVALVKFSIDGTQLKNIDDPQSSLPTMLKLVFAQSILYHLASNLVRASFALQYIRLFSLIPPIIWTCYLLFVLIFGTATWGIFGNVFLCNPVQSYWDLTISGTCMNKENHFWSTSIIGIVLDFAIWMLPIPVVGRLKLPRRQKTGLLIVFGLGGFVCIIAILRLVLVYDATHRNQVTKSGTYALIFSSIEVNIAIMCASLLVMKPLFARFMPSIVSEQPMSASEDRRICRALTGLHLLNSGTGIDEEKSDDGRRDTLVDGGDVLGRMATPKERRNLRKGLGRNWRHTM
ncbi:hypothetical protein EJ02DRAFT_345713 [Clathrospora elynae]|uniref:Rhodopsin domain-containing protein n=1 Tax=Clathrospora elynae TaxID=706981 RepID=A0A6A5SUP6_9PLEO|nr:hypothetical protein EJ02DRAFT_345713 [Clathrospora elynae]